MVPSPRWMVRGPNSERLQILVSYRKDTPMKRQLSANDLGRVAEKFVRVQRAIELSGQSVEDGQLMSATLLKGVEGAHLPADFPLPQMSPNAG